MNKDHYKLLTTSVEAWNIWRNSVPGLRVDLKGANLRRATLTEADLYNCDLAGADMTAAWLVGVDFSRSDLTGAILEDSTAAQASFYKADLTGANFDGAFLYKAVFQDAILKDVNLLRAELSWTILDELDEARLIKGQMEQSLLALGIAPQVTVQTKDWGHLIRVSVGSEELGNEITPDEIPVHNTNGDTPWGNRLRSLTVWTFTDDGQTAYIRLPERCYVLHTADLMAGNLFAQAVGQAWYNTAEDEIAQFILEATQAERDRIVGLGGDHKAADIAQLAYQRVCRMVGVDPEEEGEGDD